MLSYLSPKEKDRGRGSLNGGRNPPAPLSNVQVFLSPLASMERRAAKLPRQGTPHTSVASMPTSLVSSWTSTLEANGQFEDPLDPPIPQLNELRGLTSTEIQKPNHPVGLLTVVPEELPSAALASPDPFLSTSLAFSQQETTVAPLPSPLSLWKPQHTTDVDATPTATVAETMWSSPPPPPMHSTPYKTNLSQPSPPWPSPLVRDILSVLQSPAPPPNTPDPDAFNIDPLNDKDAGDDSLDVIFRTLLVSPAPFHEIPSSRSTQLVGINDAAIGTGWSDVSPPPPPNLSSRDVDKLLEGPIWPSPTNSVPSPTLSSPIREVLETELKSTMDAFATPFSTTATPGSWQPTTTMTMTGEFLSYRDLCDTSDEFDDSSRDEDDKEDLHKFVDINSGSTTKKIFGDSSSLSPSSGTYHVLAKFRSQGRDVSNRFDGNSDNVTDDDRFKTVLGDINNSFDHNYTQYQGAPALEAPKETAD